MKTVIDLFAGAGGLSLGAERAGFNVIAAFDTDAQAMETHKKNFPGTVHSSVDVASLTGKDLLRLAGLEKGELVGLIGGPPCQGFSTIGKRNKRDKRNGLFQHFFKLVKEAQPDIFLAENVPGILNSNFDSLREGALEYVKKDYTVLNPIKIKASEFGVPTTRTRVFFIGVRKEIANGLSVDKFLPGKSPTVTVREALEGLPVRISPFWKEAGGWKKVGSMKNTVFSRKISGGVPNGVGDKEALKKYRSENEVSGCIGTKHNLEVKARFGLLKHGEMDNVSKAQRLDPDGFCPTLRAGTGRDKGSFQAVRPVHFSSNRVITPREAARLQGFPDWFIFHRTKWHSFRQIGNSVSPIVSEFLLKKIKNQTNI